MPKEDNPRREEILSHTPFLKTYFKYIASLEESSHGDPKLWKRMQELNEQYQETIININGQDFYNEMIDKFISLILISHVRKPSHLYETDSQDITEPVLEEIKFLCSLGFEIGSKATFEDSKPFLEDICDSYQQMTTIFSPGVLENMSEHDISKMLVLNVLARGVFFAQIPGKPVDYNPFKDFINTLEF